MSFGSDSNRRVLSELRYKGSVINRYTTKAFERDRLFIPFRDSLRPFFHFERVIGIEPTLIPDWQPSAPPFMRYPRFSEPGGIQTPNLLIRSQIFCSVELQAHLWFQWNSNPHGPY